VKPTGSAKTPRASADELKVNGHSDRWLAQGFPWVYPNEVVGAPVREAGRDVLVRGPSGAARGRAITDTGWIAARVFREDDGPLDAAWLHGRLEAARRRREAVLPAGCEAWRMVHGENDGLPGIRVDAFGSHRIVVLDTPSVAGLLPALVDALRADPGVTAIWLAYRPDARDERSFDDVQPRPGLLWSEAASDPREDEVIVREGPMRIAVRPWEAPDVGLYNDMREVRRWLADRWAGAEVLNLFSFTGAFSVAAALGGASSVTSVDLSGAALQRLEANLRLNGIDPAGHPSLAEDSFKVLDRLRRTGRRFDRVIVDPPSFSRSAAGVWSARQDMPRLVSAAASVLAPGGWLILASNLGQVAPRELRGQVATGLQKAGRRAVELAWFGAAPDFPAAVQFPEGHYLKIGVWAVGD
jgi:23S rRNA (cytosine1962-C5)-methyltransferase